MLSPVYAEIEVFIHLQRPPARGGAEISVKTGWVGGNISLVALSSVTQSADDL
jgi:hypothetical protein